MDQIIFGLTVTEWATMVGVWAVSSIVLTIIKGLLISRFAKMADRTENQIDDILEEINKYKDQMKKEKVDNSILSIANEHKAINAGQVVSLIKNEIKMKKLFLTLAIVALVASTAFAETLHSWNEGPTKKSIVQFVKDVSTIGSPKFVPQAERIAVFDNDGTLWAEQPMYFQLAFVIDRVKAMASDHPEWATQEPFSFILQGDIKAALAGGNHALLELAMATHANNTTEEFAQIVKDWTASAKHPKTNKPYTDMIYQPMLELLEYLRANGFKTYITSGGGIEFMRTFSEEVYGIPPEQVIGSSIKTKFEIRNGMPTLVRIPEMNFLDDKEGKPIAINQHIGRRPIAAFGNSDGDLQMLQWTCAGDGSRFCLYVHHTDAKREWAYDRKSHIGKLDKGLDEAHEKGWTVVDMKKDWKRVFAFDGNLR